MVSVCDCDPAVCCVGDKDETEGTGLLCCPPPPPLPPPPPQLTTMANRTSIVRNGRSERRCRTAMPTKQTPISGNMVLAIQPMRVFSFAVRRNCPDWPGEVVVIVTI